MGPIDFDTLPGQSVLHKLLHYFKACADLKKGFHIIVPEVLPAETQRGETCKLKALADSMQHAAYKAHATRPPLYKDRRYVGPSLRQLAKIHGSAVGEVYSLEMLLAICHDAGFSATTYAPFNEDEYILQVSQLVDKNLAPVVFYDLDKTPGERYGFPRIGDGSNEHGATVVAYYKTQYDETRFIVTMWGRYYDFDGMELALSACHSLVERRTPETFVKCMDTLMGKTCWILNKNRFHPAYLRTAHEMKPSDTPLKGKILVVTGPQPTLAASDSRFFPAGGEAAKPATDAYNSEPGEGIMFS
ncbi:hypothetical protein [Legionella nagasakiensis]|uniref:hypothetical protein n=1 Tax=Legionella nagasakiensis TaxID=535290 RepID=UPI001054D56C|nr:hypothetical protein [Legionella nagasakiensis]